MPERQGLWQVPALWPNGECFILGGGPSLAKIDIDSLRGRRVIAVNQAFKLAPWLDVMFYGDCRWLQQYSHGLLDFAGLKVTACEKHASEPGIKAVRRRNRPYGISRDPGFLNWNLSSGASAINLACHFGVKRIILLGFDMKKNGNRCNWHDDYINPVKLGAKNPYPRFMHPFPYIAEDLIKMNVECINATAGSALEEFSIVSPCDVGVKEKPQPNQGSEE